MSLSSTASRQLGGARSRHRIATFLAAFLVGGRLASAQVLVAPGVEPVDAVRPTAAREPAPAPGDVRTALAARAGTEAAGRPLPPQVIATPDVEEELEVIERRSQLMITRTGVVRTAIADSSVIDVVQYSPSEIAVIGLARGATTLTLWFAESPDPLIYLVKVIADPSLEEQRHVDFGRLERRIAEIFPNSKVHLVPLSRKIVVMGQARDGEEAARILEIVRGEYINQYGYLFGGGNGVAAGAVVAAGTDLDVLGGAAGLGPYSSYIVNMLEVPGEQQVQLRVRIAELNRQQLRRMGVDWSVLFDGGQQFIGSTMGGGLGTLTGVFENGEINVLLNWLASNGTIKVLSEPTMTVLSGHSASFLSGGEFAVPTIVGIGGAQGQQTTFRGFGTSLIATPTIIDRDLVRMRIVPEFSQINVANSVNGIPGVDSRRVQTTVQLREGQTLAIAGLIARQQATEVTRVPFLGDIPWIGPLVFAAKRATEDETELLILVSPEIVRPMEADEVPPVPGFEVTHPHDHELYKRGRTEGAPDLQQYQLAPYGRGAGHGIPVGYKLFEPAPASPSYPPQATGHYRGTPEYPYGAAGGEIVPADPRYAPEHDLRPRPEPQPIRSAPSMHTPPPDAYGPVQTLPAPQSGAAPSGGRYDVRNTPPAVPREIRPIPRSGSPSTMMMQPMPGTHPAPGTLPPTPSEEYHSPNLQGPSAHRPGEYRTSQNWPGYGQPVVVPADHAPPEHWAGRPEYDTYTR